MTEIRVKLPGANTLQWMRRVALSITLISTILPVTAVARGPQLGGYWVINDELSDDTDKQVEKAIKDGGGRIPHTDKKGKGRYKGGPSDQQFYDHISYDDNLRIQENEPEFRFSYEEGFERVFYSDNRGRSVSASGLQSGAGKDYSFASWEGSKLMVESRPLDGGHAMETYSLDPDGRLRVEMHLKPLMFPAPIDIVRVYDRAPTEQKSGDGSQKSE